MLLAYDADAAPGPPAPAKPATSADAKNKAEAIKLLAEGNALTNDGDYVEALEKFRAAYAMYPSPKLLLNIGTMLRQLGRNVEAAAVYEQYLRDPEAEVPQVELLNRTLDEIDSLVGHLRITVSPRDAAVSLDGKPIDMSPEVVEVRVEPGTHKVVAEKKGFPPALVTITLGRGEEKAAALKLEPTRVVEKTNMTTIAGISCLAVGAFGFIASGITGGLVISANNTYVTYCPTNRCSTFAGYEAAQLGKNLLIANGLSWAAGIAGAGLGSGLLIWGHKRAKKQSILISPGFIGVQGQF